MIVASKRIAFEVSIVVLIALCYRVVAIVWPFPLSRCTNTLYGGGALSE